MMELALPIAVNVVLGLLLLAVLARRGGADGETLTGPEEAVGRYRAQFPDAAGVATVAANRRAALLALDSGRVGLLQRQGRRWNARELAPGDLAGVDLGTDGAVALAFTDFGWARARLEFGDAAVRAAWLARLQALTGVPPSPYAAEAPHA